MPDPVRLGDVLWELPRHGRMLVPGRIVADDALLDGLRDDGALTQLANVAALPGVVDAVLAMPDAHQGYGFPVGGVAAMAVADGVVSPGGVGYDINCGVRLLALPLSRDELGARTSSLVREISHAIPLGARREGLRSLSPRELDDVLLRGAAAVGGHDGSGGEDDLAFTESAGRLPGADVAAVSARARQRGHHQLGTLGSGNHFVEVGWVERVLDATAARAFGLDAGGVTVLIHTGSRGLGHQVCVDYVRRMDEARARLAIDLADRQLGCAPIASPEGREYLAAMAAAANFAWANRQAIAREVRLAIGRVLGSEVATATRQVYDLAHNIATFETHAGRELLVHRKGATRAVPAGSADLPAAYRAVGQPVFIPGSMGTASYVLVGAAAAVEGAFGSACHGAGRQLSRTAARRSVDGAQLRRQLEADGIVVRCPSNGALAEEAPCAYKDVDHVVDVVRRARLAMPVARLRPLGIVKG